LFFTDISLVKRVLQNLLDNALKFTPEGGKIILSMSCDNKQVYVSVKDTGSGIPEDQITEIFDRFKQAKFNEQKNQGVGLGLAIVKKILEIHDSKISVFNRPEKGAEFRFNLTMA